MTEISFHFNATDKLTYACRLLRKAVNGGAQVVVAAAPETLANLDTLLWTISPLDFIAHCFANADAALVSASPVLLGMPDATLQRQRAPFALQSAKESRDNGAYAVSINSPACAVTGPVVLVNLGDEVPEGFERFVRLVEIVAAGEEDRVRARDRWKHYAHRGYAITRHDLAAKLGAQSAS